MKKSPSQLSERAINVIRLEESLIAKDTSVVETPRAFAKSLMVTLGLFTSVRYVSANY